MATLITAATVGAVCATTTPAAAAPKGGDSVTLTCRSISKRIDQLAAELGGHRAIPNDPRRAELSRLLDAWDELCARHFGANPRIFA